MGVQQWSLFTPAKFVGWANFHRLFAGDPLFGIALRNAVVFTVGTVVPTLAISLIVAATLNRKIKGIGIFRTVLFLPLAVSAVVMAVGWRFVFDTNNGLLNIMLRWIVIGPGPSLVHPTWAML